MHGDILQVQVCLTSSIIGKLALLYVPKTSHCFKYFFLENDHFGNVVCQDWEFWKTDVGKQNFVERYIW
jgi:hypothetical protein